VCVCVCFSVFVSLHRRRRVGPLRCDVVLAAYTEEVLSRYEEELRALRDYYDTNREVFNKVAERDELFQKFLAFEVSYDFSASYKENLTGDDAVALNM